MDDVLARSTSLKSSVHTRGGVTVQVGSARTTRQRRFGGGICVVGVAAPGAPFLADAFPRSVMKTSRHREADFYAEHVRLVSRDSLGSLPGLAGPWPSRIQDAVRLALSVGAPAVDVVLVRASDALPWDMDHPDVIDAVGTFLDELPGALVSIPDLGGPAPVGPGTGEPIEERATRFLRGVERYAQKWVDRYQVAVLDALPLPSSDEAWFLRRLMGHDVALCRWQGTPRQMATHGWRCAGALVGGMVASASDRVGGGLLGQAVTVPAGRLIAPARIPELTLPADGSSVGERDEDTAYVTARLDPGQGRVTIVSEPTFRQPIGGWSLPALHAVKTIHRRIIETAERFVFEVVDDGQAISLAVAIRRSLQVFHDQGLLSGPDEKGPPEVKGTPVRNPAQPGLAADIKAQLRPWSQKVAVRVSLRPGNRPSLEVAS